MAKKVYALLVGIDEYRPPVRPLQGCKADIWAIQQFLESRVAKGEFTLEIQTLVDAQATREGIIAGFKKHLSKAKAGDVALFYYSGHGGSEPAPQVFWRIEPDRQNETLVAFDSRHKDGEGKEVYDLSDKELAQLLFELSANQPHIAVVLDCCHSGSGTRAGNGDVEDEGFRVRRAPTDTRLRPLESYYGHAQLAELSSTRSSGSDWIGPFTREAEGQSQPTPHVLLAACRPDQTAKEMAHGQGQRGAFSVALLEALEQPGRQSYRDLYKRLENQVKNLVPRQNPQLELLAGQPDELFLGGAVPERPPYFTLRFSQNAWTIDGGAIHGVVQGSQLAVFPASSETQVLADPTQALTTATVQTVQPGESQVVLSSQLEEATYWAVVTAQSMRPLRVVLEGDPAALQPLRQFLASSAFVAEARQEAEYRVWLKHGSYWITLPASDRPLTEALDLSAPNSAKTLLDRLESITRWRNIKDLHNPTSQLATQVQMEILGPSGAPLEPGTTLLQTNEPNTYPSIKVRLTNHSRQKLYCALLSLAESFAVDSLVESDKQVEVLNEGDTLEVNRGQAIAFQVPDTLWNLGITERTDILKLIVSTAGFDAGLLCQEALAHPTQLEVTRGFDNPLQQLMRGVATREPVKQTQQYADWCTQSFNLTLLRPQASTALDTAKAVAVGVEGQTITLKPHPLKARVSLGARLEATRSAQSVNLPAILRDHPGSVQPLQFSSTRGSSGALEVLELSEIENPQAVTPENPLELELPTGFNPETEQIIPLVIHKDADGTEYFLPLGYAEPGASGGGSTATVKLDYLPTLPDVPAEEHARSLLRSLRMMFVKIVGEALGLEVNNQTLSLVEVSREGTPVYQRDPNEIKQRVAALQPGDKVLLYVHGILGKTENMVGTVVSTPSGSHEPIGQHYQMILAYDYENLTTSIKESGQRLREMLIEVGLGPRHGKQVHIVAHSMGGLVSRWMIEHKGGGADQMVQHLVMLGTPNGGSPWLNLKEWVTHLLTLAVNGLAPAAWVSTILNGAVLVLRAATTTAELRPNSPFIQDLGTQLAPGVKYTFIAGDATKQGNEVRQALAARLMDLALHGASRQLFAGMPNDLATSVESVLSACPDPKPDPIGSDHFSYFVPEGGLAALMEKLTDPKP